MRALVHNRMVRLAEDHPLPIRGDDEALVRVHMAGICKTDLELIKGYMGFQGVLGHEFVGRVAESTGGRWIGKRVVGEINAACFGCETCLAGIPSQCPNRTTLGIDRRDGAFAEYLSLPLACLHEVPGEVPDERAVFTEPLAAACQILDLVPIQPRDRVVVIGDGKLGLLVAQVISLTGCDLLVLGHHADHLDLLSKRGIQTSLADGQLGGHPARFDIVVECTGNPRGFELAQRLVRPRGTIVLKSTYQGTPAIDMSKVVVDEVRVVGSRCGPFDTALRLLAANQVDVEMLIQARFPLEHAMEALGHASQPGMLKVLMDIA